MPNYHNIIIPLYKDSKYPYFQLLGNHIIKINYGDDYDVTSNDIYRIVELTLEHEGETPHLIKFLSVFGEFTTITLGALEAVQKVTTGIKAEAFVSNSLSQKILGNYYKSKKEQEHSVKIFGNEEDALEWLKSIK